MTQHSSIDLRDRLSELSVEQLRMILIEQYRADETDIELIKAVSAVLESKSDMGPGDPEEAYQELLAHYAGTEPLYDELDGEAGDRKSPRKPARANRLIRFGLVLAAVLAVFLATSVAASAMGLNLSHVFARWSENTMSLSGSYMPFEDYSVAREKLEELGVKAKTVPTYAPEGYTVRQFSAEKTFEGDVVILLLGKGEDTILLRYLLTDDVPDVFFAKDDGEPEEYHSGGVTHYITTNAGQSRATWFLDDEMIMCSVTTTEDRSQLLRIIDSIYQGKGK